MTQELIQPPTCSTSIPSGDCALGVAAWAVVCALDDELMEMKVCTKCGDPKVLEEFTKCTRASDGRAYWCKSCVAAQGRKYRQGNKEKVRELKRKWAAENKEKVAAHRKRFHEKNKEKISAKRKNDYQENKEEYTDHLLKYIYGMSLDEYDRMLKSQGHSCALCGEPLGEPVKGKSRHPIDHDHKGGNGRSKCSRGDVRGILHLSCNTLLGYVEKHPDLIEKAKKYLVGFK